MALGLEEGHETVSGVVVHTDLRLKIICNFMK